VSVWVFIPYFRRKRSMRPAVSTSFCLPVKKGWQFEQISTRISLAVERVTNSFPHAQWTRINLYSGWMSGFMGRGTIARSPACVYWLGPRPGARAKWSMRAGPRSRR